MLTLWINSETNALLPNWNAFGTSTLPQIKQGDAIELEIHWVKSDPAGQFMEEVVMPPSSVIKVAVGLASGGPTGGYFVYSFEGDTVNIPYNATEEDANTLINGLPSITSAGGVIVSIVNQRTFRIVFNQVGAREMSSCDSTPLSPSTTVSVVRINAGSPTSKEVQNLRPKLLPVAYSESFTNSPEPVISIVDIDSITKRISISPSPKFGTFTISNGTGTTSALSINVSAGDITNALIASGISSSTRSYSVAKSGDYSWDIYRTSGTSEVLSITTNGLIGFSSKVGIIDFNTLEVEDLLAGQATVNAVIEVEYSYGSSKQTIYQGRVVIANDLIEQSTYNPIPFPEVGGGIEEAPINGIKYARQDGAWVSFAEEDNQGITQAAGDARYAQLSGADFTGSITTTGRMAIGGGLAVNPVNKLAIYNGNIVFSSGYGIAFGDGTTLTTAPVPFNPAGYATESWVTTYVSGIGYLTISDYPITSLTSANYKSHRGQATSTYTLEYFDPYSQTNSTIDITITAPSGLKYEGWSVQFTASQSLGYVLVDDANSQLLFGVNSGGVTSMMDAISNTFTGSGSVVPAGWSLSFSNTGGFYAPSESLAFGTNILIPARNISQGYKPVLEGGVIFDLTVDAKVNTEYNKILSTDAYGNVGWSAVSSILSGYALLSGATFTGKVNTAASTSLSAGFNISAGVAPSSPISGDIWINTGGSNINYRSPTSQTLSIATHQLTNTFTSPQIIDTTSATLAGIRVTQKGTAPAIVIEDSINPDSDSTIIDASGNVGIGVSSASGAWTADAKLAVKGATSLALLRLTQTGTGNVLLVEDEASPDATPFVIGPDGRVGIGGSVSATTTNKLAIYNGNILFSNGFGLVFGDGTTQTTAYVPSNVTITGGTINNITIDGGTF